MNGTQQLNVKLNSETRRVRLADLYPWAGIVGIATYIFVECFLE